MHLSNTAEKSVWKLIWEGFEMPTKTLQQFWVKTWAIFLNMFNIQAAGLQTFVTETIGNLLANDIWKGFSNMFQTLSGFFSIFLHCYLKI